MSHPEIHRNATAFAPGDVYGGGPGGTAFVASTEVAQGDRVCGLCQVSEEGAIERAVTEATAFTLERR